MNPALDDGDVRIWQGDAEDTLACLPSSSVHCIVTSPPFFALRDYGEPGQIGLEQTPEEWAARLVAVFRECRRVLRPDGTFWLEVGDSYAGGTAGRKDEDSIRRIDAASGRRPLAEGYPANDAGGVSARVVPAGCKAKDLIGAPWLLAFALRADGWFLRAENIWHKPNPMPESVLDRTTRAHSQVFMLTSSPRYYYDAEAIREPLDEASLARYERSSRYDDTLEVDAVPYKATRPRGTKRRTVREGIDVNGGGQGAGEMSWLSDVGGNARSVWKIPSEPTTFAHFATMPTDLAAKCIRAGSSEHGCCSECGAPWRRITETEYGEDRTNDWALRAANGAKTGGVGKNFRQSNRTSHGWEPTCAHDAERMPCVILDPFMGSGTTALVARRLGRHAVGVELSPEYVRIASERLSQLALPL